MTEQPQLFKKSLSLVDATSIVAGSMIGSGIFIVSAELARILGSPGWLLVAWIITGLLTIAGIFILRRKRPDVERPYKAFGYPIVPALYMLTASLIMIILLICRPKYTWPGLIIVVLGIPVYYIWKQYSKK